MSPPFNTNMSVAHRHGLNHGLKKPSKVREHGGNAAI
jgi:hypothetical protein